MEKFTDYTLNRDRVYNPETDQVYTVDQNFYQYYDTHRDQYRQQNMQRADRRPVPKPRRARREPAHRAEHVTGARVVREGGSPSPRDRVFRRPMATPFLRVP